MSKTFIICSGFLLFLFCATDSGKQIHQSPKVDVTRNSLNRSEIEKIKECNLEFDSCLKKCDSQFSELFQARDTRNSECKQSCVAKLEHKEGCVIHFQSRTRRIYRSNASPVGY